MTTNSPNSDDGVASAAAGAAQVRVFREQSREGGLHLDPYRPPDLAGWLLGLIEHGAFNDPSEVTLFVTLGEQREMEPHSDLRQELLRRSIQAAIDDPRPCLPHEAAAEEIMASLAAPAVWRREWP
jgi:hypothetical protein